MRLLLCFAIATTVLAAQPPAASDPTIRLNVQQVLVPVVVTDKKGHHVSGLHASDFTILEDGVRQEIAAFSTDSAGSVDDINGLTKPVNPGTPRRTYVICIDTLHTLPANAGRIREALENFFRSEKGTDAQYVVIGIGRQMQVLQTATTSTLSVLQKVRNAAFQGAMGGVDASAFAAQLNDLRNRLEVFCTRCSCNTRSKLSPCESETEAVKQAIAAAAEQWTGMTDGLAVQFRNVVEELGKLPTARTLILISDGFSLDPKREVYAVASAYLPGTPQFRWENPKEGEPRLQDALKIATQRNVAIYAIDSHGGYAPALSSTGSIDASQSGGNHDFQTVIQSNSQIRSAAPIRSTPLQTSQGLQTGGTTTSEPSPTMELLAHATGGVYTHDSKDLLKQLNAAMADGRQYYVLAYVPKDSSTDGRFRRITVEVGDKTFGIRAKSGYWATRSDQ